MSREEMQKELEQNVAEVEKLGKIIARLQMRQGRIFENACKLKELIDKSSSKPVLGNT